MTTRHQNDPVRHTIEAGARELRCKSAAFLYFIRELFLYCLFSHFLSSVRLLNRESARCINVIY